MLGHSLEELGFTKEIEPPYFAVKESVFPFRRFPGVDPMLGPEMRSTGEVMGLDEDFGLAFAKSQLAAGQIVPRSGGVLFSVKNADKAATVALARGFQEEGYQIFATGGTAAYLKGNGLDVRRVHKIREGRPNIIDLVKSQEIHLLINTPEGRYTPADSYSIRRAALEYNIPYTTTMAAARATLDAIRALKRGKLEVKSLQEYHAQVQQSRRP
jgi:carbamoyl-phosphate synthase large subunit